MIRVASLAIPKCAARRRGVSRTEMSWSFPRSHFFLPFFTELQQASVSCFGIAFLVSAWHREDPQRGCKEEEHSEPARPLPSRSTSRHIGVSGHLDTHFLLHCASWGYWPSRRWHTSSSSQHTDRHLLLPTRVGHGQGGRPAFNSTHHLA